MSHSVMVYLLVDHSVKEKFLIYFFMSFIIVVSFCLSLT